MLAASFVFCWSSLAHWLLLHQRGDWLCSFASLTSREGGAEAPSSGSPAFHKHVHTVHTLIQEMVSCSLWDHLWWSLWNEKEAKTVGKVSIREEDKWPSIALEMIAMESTKITHKWRGKKWIERENCIELHIFQCPSTSIFLFRDTFIRLSEQRQISATLPKSPNIIHSTFLRIPVGRSFKPVNKQLECNCEDK